MKPLLPLRALPQERAIAVDPPMTTWVREAWTRRLRYYSGRTLTHAALNIEQTYHGDHLAMLGRQFSPGIVQGLEVSLTRGPLSGPPVPTAPELDVDAALDAAMETLAFADWGVTPAQGRLRAGAWLDISAGAGLTALGEDVYLPTPLRARLDRLPVVDAASTVIPHGLGVLVLQPISAQVTDASPSHDPCEIDPADDAYADWQLADGCRLAFHPWPRDWRPLPPPDARFRNRVEYTIFAREMAQGELPWEKHGVALGLLYVSRVGLVTWVDRHAVVRQGGSPRRSMVVNTGNGTPRLWQARMQACNDYVLELRNQGLPWDAVFNRFQFLPPIGILPPDAMSLADGRFEFLPSRYDIEAVPVPEEQLEIALQESAGLAPFDLFTADRVQVLVPVPQAQFEPRLLKREQVDPLFPNTIGELLSELNAGVGQRNSLRTMANWVVAAVDRQTLPDYADPDPEAVPGEEPVVWVPPVNFAAQTRTHVANLHDKLVKAKAPLSAAELAELDPVALDQDRFTGLKNIIAELQWRIDLSNHAVDFGFLRLQTDIYRMRQMMLGNVNATRLATSPVLANIAQGVTNYATQQNLQSFFEQAYKVNATTTGAAPAASNTINPSNNAFNATMVPRASTFVAAPQATNTAANKAATYAGAETLASAITSAEIDQQSAIVGDALEFRTTSVAERLAEPPGPEAKTYAVATKAEVVASLANLPISLEGIEVGLASNGMAVLTRDEFNEWLKKHGFNDAQQAVLEGRVARSNDHVNVSLAPFNPREQALLGESAVSLRRALNELIGRNRRPLASEGLAGLVLNGAFDPHPADGDEASFVSVGVGALETTVAMLRKVEGRILSYRQVVDLCKKTLASVEKVARAWQQALSVVDRQVAEQRHDLTVARALLAEEQARVSKINARRAQVIKESVRFLVFRRARSTETRRDVRALEIHGEYQDPVPGCLRSKHATPSELGAMVALLRDVPLAWLPFAIPRFEALGYTGILRNVFASAKEQATLRLASNIKPATLRIQPIDTVVTQQTQTLSVHLEARAKINLAQFEGETLLGLAAKGAELLSIGDFIKDAQIDTPLSRPMAQEIERIEHVAGCLYERLSAVLPAVRMRWAEKLSVFDRSIPLQSLAVLPGWDSVDSELARDLQRFVDWLFQRVNSKVPAAVSLINDLVRVCLLLASHAPVDRIIHGRVVRPVAGRIGDWVELACDGEPPRVGMSVALHRGMEVIATGVVRDVANGSAHVAITAAPGGQFQVEAGAIAKLLSAH